MSQKQRSQFGYFVQVQDRDSYGDRYRRLTITFKGGRWVDQSKLAGNAAKHGDQGMADHYHGKALKAGKLSDSTEIFDCGSFQDAPEFVISWQSTPNLDGWYGGHLETETLDLRLDALSSMASTLGKIRKALQDADSLDAEVLIPVLIASLNALPIRYSTWNHADDGGLSEYIHDADPNLASALAGAYVTEAA